MIDQAADDNFLQVTNISKTDERSIVLQDISLTIPRYKKLAIAGETGSGKSTLLKIIAGLSQPDSGRVHFCNERVVGPDWKLIPGHPGIAYLSQYFELQNFLKVRQVLGYANTLTDEAASELFVICRIDHLLDRRTDELSGGEKQRIAMARLLITAPKLLLLDEPFSNTDMVHKTLLKSVIKDISDQLNITCMLISHDPLDVLSWADEILVLRNGKIVQQGTPQEIYQQPHDEYTGGLFGKYNLITPATAALFPEMRHLVHDDKPIFMRPEKFKITTAHTGLRSVVSAGQTTEGTVEDVLFLGSSADVIVTLGEQSVIVKTTDLRFKKGDRVFIGLAG